MSNVININFQDTIISQWEEAVDKKSAEKTLAFKYFNGNKEDLNNYLFPRDSISADKKTYVLRIDHEHQTAIRALADGFDVLLLLR